jgi:hypothetical protein
MTIIKLGVLALAVALVSFVSLSVAFAATGVTDPDSAGVFDLLKPIVESVAKGEFALSAALGVIAAMALTKKYLPDRFGGKFVRSDLGGMLSAFIYASAGSVVTALSTGGDVTSSTMRAALYIGMGSIGGFVALHKLASAFVGTKWWNEKAPAWLRALVSVVLALIGSNAASKQAEKNAKAAGDAAVKEKPATGLGEFTDVN